jgi:hypothetical protein
MCPVTSKHFGYRKKFRAAYTGSCEKRISAPNEILYYNAAKNWGAGPEREQADVLQVALEDHGELNNKVKGEGLFAPWTTS